MKQRIESAELETFPRGDGENQTVHVRTQGGGLFAVRVTPPSRQSKDLGMTADNYVDFIGTDVEVPL